MHHDKKQCSVCDPPFMERNNYYYGKLMTVRDFFAEQTYFNEKRWLINRMVIGTGVVCGLNAEPNPGKPNSVIIRAGLAIDCCGRELLNCEDYVVDLDPEDHECHDPKESQSQSNQKTQQSSKQDPNQKDQANPPSAKDIKENREKWGERLILCMEYHKCKTEPVHLPAEGCDQDGQDQFNRIRDSFRIRVQYEEDIPEENKCPQPDEPYEECPSNTDVHKACPPNSEGYPIHDQLCEHLSGSCPDCGQEKHCCVILGRVLVWPEKITPLPKGENPFLLIQPCHRRKLVYNNPLLFHLITCHKDLPHVVEKNWGHGKDEDWDTEYPPDIKNVWDAHRIYRDGLQITFDKEMERETINDHTFLVSVTTIESGTAQYWNERVPSEEIVYDDATRTATFKFSLRWLNDTYTHSDLINESADFFVVLKGDLIMSKENVNRLPKPLDGNHIGGKLPSGNGSPGGDFVSWFKMPELPNPLKPPPKQKTKQEGKKS